MQRKVCMPVWKPRGLSSSRGILLAEKICLDKINAYRAQRRWRRVHSFCANFVTALLAEKVERCVHENALIADAKFKSTFEPLERTRKRLVTSAVSTLVETDKPWDAEPYNILYTHSPERNERSCSSADIGPFAYIPCGLPKSMRQRAKRSAILIYYNIDERKDGWLEKGCSSTLKAEFCNGANKFSSINIKNKLECFDFITN